MTQESLRVFRFTINTLAEHDPRSAGYLADARALGFHGIDQIKVQDLYFLEGCLRDADLPILANQLLSDPVRSWQVGRRSAEVRFPTRQG